MFFVTLALLGSKPGSARIQKSMFGIRKEMKGSAAVLRNRNRRNRNFLPEPEPEP